MQANERQVGGQHYMKAGDMQHWDMVAQLGLDYFQGQITKYVFRWRDKNGLEDLLKAVHYTEKYIEVHKPYYSGSAHEDVGRYIKQFKLDYWQGTVLNLVVNCNVVPKLHEAKRVLEEYLGMQQT